MTLQYIWTKQRNQNVISEVKVSVVKNETLGLLNYTQELILLHRH